MNKFHFAYIDENGIEQHKEQITGARFTEARVSFTNDCKRNSWQFLYFRRAI